VSSIEQFEICTFLPISGKSENQRTNSRWGAGGRVEETEGVRMEGMKLVGRQTKE